MNDVVKLVTKWRGEPTIGGNITTWRTIPSRSARLVAFPEGLNASLAQSLNRIGINELFSHQAEAWELIQVGKNAGIVTGTASGKTLCYNLPVINHLLNNSQATALYLFPTKALSRDQYDMITHIIPNKSLEGLFTSFNPIASGVYDGDTPRKDRTTIRKNARLVFSNPDMLHAGILPRHTDWAMFFRNLRFLVIDEMHIYRGVFGSHVANLIRRLKRITNFYGSNPQFILTSATIANPKELAEKLTEEEIHIIDEDGSALGSKHFLIYNPPIVDQRLGLRRSALHESVRLAEDLINYDIQTIIFARSRRTVEIILTYLRETYSSDYKPPSTLEITGVDSNISRLIRGYRSGYLPLHRREIESGLRKGSVRAVVATNALELGIDIGGIGATLLVGYPGTIAATWQQAGRSGRGDTPSLSVLVTTADPIDQFFASNPDYFFDRQPEHALINADNLLILLDHLRCAAFELPFNEGDRFGKVPISTLQEFLDILQLDGVLHKSGERYYWMADNNPAHNISLRNASTSNIILQTSENQSSKTIGFVDLPSAYWLVHPEAVYLHDGNTYVVQDLDLDENIAQLIKFDTDYYTEPRRETTVELLNLSGQDEMIGASKSYGDIKVTSQLIGFRKIRWFTHENLGNGDVTLPPTALTTTGYWLTVNDSTIDVLRSEAKWSGDPNEYGPQWSSLRNEVRKRDGYRCQVCGLPETKRSHDVHHITPFRFFQTQQEANRIENLVTLCPQCHRRAETAVRVKSGLSGLSYVFKHIAPLFLMCDTRDIGVHADPKSPLTEGKPVIVLYDLIPAGIGFSQQLFNLHEEILIYSRALISACECIDGCPSCVGPGGESGSGSKEETLALINALT